MKIIAWLYHIVTIFSNRMDNNNTYISSNIIMFVGKYLKLDLERVQ